MTDNAFCYVKGQFRSGDGGPRSPPPPHSALHAAHERESRALHSNRVARMGLRQTLSLIARSCWRAPAFSHILQLHAAPHCARSSTADKPSFGVTTSPVTTASGYGRRLMGRSGEPRT
jgi:hypothetical protein